MARFKYTAKGPGGSLVNGEINAANKAAAIDIMTSKGLIPNEISSAKNTIPWWQREIYLGRTNQVPKKDLLTFFSMLATLLEAGVPVAEALKYTEDNAQNPRLRSSLSGIRAEVEGGSSLSAALEFETSTMPNQWRQALSLGEQSNTLSQAASEAAKALSAELRIESELRSALIYPTILLIMSLGVMALIVFYLVPVLMPVFDVADAEPPVVLRLMNGTRSFVVSNWVMLGQLLIVVALIGFLARQRIANLGRMLALALPLVRKYSAQKASLQLCRSLQSLLVSGAPVLRALRSSRDLIDGPAKKREIDQAITLVEAGASLSEGVNEVGFLDPLAKTLIGSGDETDKLPQMLELACQTLETDTSATLKRVMTILTPLITLLIGALVAIMILSTVTAILDLNSVAL